MINENLRNQVLGYYSIPSSIAVLAFPFRERHAINTGDPITLKELHADLTRRHEFAHYRQSMSTPFGILLWRCFNSLISDIEYIAAFVSSFSPLPAWEVPIHSGVLQGGLDAAIQGGAKDSGAPENMSLEPLAAKLRYLRHVAEQVDVLYCFLTALIGHPGAMTVGEFLSVYEKSIVEICNRFDLVCKAKVASKRKHSETLYPQGNVSVAELVEAATRFEERLMLESFPQRTALIAEWEASAIHGVYEPAYRWLLSATTDTKVSLALIDLAFMAPIDPAFMQADDPVFYIEDLLPTLRLPRLVQEAKNHFWDEDRKELDDLLGSRICVGAGLWAPYEVAKRGVNATYLGESSWGADYRRRGGSPELDPAQAFLYIASEFQRAMSIRATSPSALLYESDDGGIPFRPTITFYENHINFGVNDLQNREAAVFLLASLFHKFLHDSAMLELIGMQESHDIKQLCALLKKRMSTPARSGDWFHSIFDSMRNSGIADSTIDHLFFGQSSPAFRLCPKTYI
jgi:hypothetical protein